MAIDLYRGWRVYTVDDSTGVCIECNVMVSTTGLTTDAAGSAVQNRHGGDSQTGPAQATTGAVALAADPYPDIDVGMVVDVKGNLRLFRDNKQIKIQKMQRVKSTDQEVQFWNKIKTFRKDVLSQPWVVDRRVLRKFEKENKRDADSKEREKKRQKLKREQEQEQEQHQREKLDTGADELGRYRPRADYGRSGTGSGARAGVGSKKAYRPSKLSSVMTTGEEQYDALGL